MKNLKRLMALTVVMLGILVGAGQVAAQSDAMNGVQAAIKAGSSRDLARYFGSKVEVSIDGDNASYSQSQAEMVLRNFFSKNPPAGFSFDHQGGSENGQQYALGKYHHKGGRYSVVVKGKKQGNTFIIDTIEFK